MKWLHRVLNFVAVAAPVVVGIVAGGPLSAVTIATAVGTLAAKLATSPAWMPGPNGN
jgi:hypothetical protein